MHHPVRFTAALAAIAGLAMGGNAVHAQAPMQHGAASAPSTRSLDAAANRQEMMDAMERMNRDMMAPQGMTGDPDRDFVAMMIPHHQGAIDMARIYMRTGRDPQIRRMAQKIITDQEREIREMRAWQASHPTPTR